jgi:hypothetical protein
MNKLSMSKFVSLLYPDQTFKKRKVLTILTVLADSDVKFLRKNGFNGFSVI